MKDKRNTKMFIEDILKCITAIETYSTSFSFEEFQKDTKTQEAILLNFVVIGEAVKNLPSPFREKLPKVPWSKAARMRDLIAHHYFEIDLQLIWDTIQNDLPSFKKEIKKLLP